jgi:hypothetical protein
VAVCAWMPMDSILSRTTKKVIFVFIITILN